MYEPKSEPLLPRREFVRRMTRHALFAGAILFVALAVGIVGYMSLAQLNFVDGLFNASMILSGMGPVATQMSDAAKVFASIYALFSGVIFISSVSIVAAPIVHRLFHHFHVDEQE